MVGIPYCLPRLGREENLAVVAAVVRRLGNGRALGSGLLIAAVGLLVVALGESYDGIVVICVGLLVIGAGIGLAFTVSTEAVLGAVPADRAGAASAISETGLELGVALGIASKIGRASCRERV